MNDCTAWIRADAITPNAVNVNASSSNSATSVSNSTGEYGTWTNPAKQSMTTPWNVATVAPPRDFPTTIAPRRTGATSISRRNPNSRSHTIETAEKIAVNRIVIEITPGNMNVRKSNP